MKFGIVHTKSKTARSDPERRNEKNVIRRVI